MTWNIAFWASLAAAGLLIGYLAVRHWQHVRNGVTVAAITSCCWMGLILVAQYTGDVARFMPAGVTIVQTDPQVLLAAHQYTAEQQDELTAYLTAQQASR